MNNKILLFFICIFPLLGLSASNSSRSKALPEKRTLKVEDDCNIKLDSVVKTNTFVNIKQSIDRYVWEASGLVVHHAKYEFDELTNTWFANPEEKTDYVLNEDGDILKETIYKTHDGVLVADSQNEYTYNEDGDLLLEIQKSWNKTAGVFENDNKTEYAYGEYGIPTLETNSQWDNNAWVVKSKKEYTYLNWELVSDLTSTMHNGSFQPKEKNEYVYDEASGDLLKETNYEFDNSVWTVNQVKDYTYTANSETYITSEMRSGVLTQHQKNESIYNNCGMIETENISSMRVGIWQNQEKLEYFYSENIPSGINDNIAGSSVRIYVDNNILYVNGEGVSNISVYAVGGTAVLNTKESPINVSGWEKGVYVVKAELIDGTQKTQKVVVK